jgi:vancomycin permeability regulator SanA
MRWGYVVPIAAILGFGLLVNYVHSETRPWSYGDPARVPDERVAIVFGAGVNPDGSLSAFLADRVQAAVNLYHAGQVQKLLLTGDNSRPDYDEASAMRRYAITHGVQVRDITLDYAGFSTYDSCYRARAIFGVTKAVLVTQEYHLPRALYTCRALGVDAVGLGTPDWGIYPDWQIAGYSAREALSTLKALWKLHVSRPLPTYLGRFEGIA